MPSRQGASRNLYLAVAEGRTIYLYVKHSVKAPPLSNFAPLWYNGWGGEHMPIRGGGAYRQHTTFKVRIRERDGHRCQLCGCGIGDVCDRHWAVVTQLDVAHIVPFKDGGLSTPDNMRVVCHPCNKREGHGSQHELAITH